MEKKIAGNLRSRCSTALPPPTNSEADPHSTIHSVGDTKAVYIASRDVPIGLEKKTPKPDVKTSPWYLYLIWVISLVP